MIERIIIAGSGGQGIMLLGKILAEAAMREGKYVTWLPCYGPEVRGGTAHCLVVISDQEIGSPYIKEADSLIIMNGLSLNRFGRRLKKSGLLILNSSLAESKDQNRHIASHPFTDIAVKLGNIKVANVVALGCLLALKKIVQLKSVSEVMVGMAPKGKEELVRINQEALEKGAGLR
jgi:2-oxoglutarate ferredoxin oxidoreductase subunit gamma